MSDGNLITRRSVFSMFSGFGLFAMASTNRIFEAFDKQYAYSQVVRNLAGYYVDKNSAAEVGVRYLERAPEEAEIGGIVRLTCEAGSDDYNRLAGANSAEVRTLIASWQREDFEHGRIVNVSGWLVSETEARLCALAALTTGRFKQTA